MLIAIGPLFDALLQEASRGRWHALARAKHFFGHNVDSGRSAQSHDLA